MRRARAAFDQFWNSTAPTFLIFVAMMSMLFMLIAMGLVVLVG